MLSDIVWILKTSFETFKTSSTLTTYVIERWIVQTSFYYVHLSLKVSTIENKNIVMFASIHLFSSQYITVHIADIKVENF